MDFHLSVLALIELLVDVRVDKSDEVFTRHT
jgi:hypothetical protein